jgi:hypothetical protein
VRSEPDNTSLSGCPSLWIKHMSASHSAPPSDRKAAYTGLIVGAIAVFIILFAVVKVTNASFAAEAAEKPASEATK